MTFFETPRGAIYPVNRIQRIARAERDKDSGFTPAGTAYLSGDMEVAISDDEIDRLIAEPKPIIPANPGFWLLTFWYNPPYVEGLAAEEPYISGRPIIAWRDTTDGIEPVTTEDTKWITAPMAVKAPDGRVMDWECEWKDQESWAANMKERADRDHAEKVGKATGAK